MTRVVAGYCRVSTLQEQQQLSFNSQKSYFTQYCKEHDYELYKVYSDEGISGTSLKNREGLLQLLNDCGIDKDLNVTKCKPPFNLILISNTSRLGRNLDDVRAIVRSLRENKVYIHFLDSNINTEDTSSDFMLNLLQLFDEQFSKDLSNKVKAGFIKSAITTNKVHTNSRLYGYNLIDGILNPVEYECNVIRLIFDLYSKGYGFRRISNILTEQGITTREGKRFNKSTLLNIITNEKYVGINNRLKYQKHSISSTTADLREGAEKYFKQCDNIIPLITKETFDKCQQILQSKQGVRKGINPGTSLYAGKIKCGVCNSSYVCNTDRGRKFYNCTNKFKYGTKVCNNKNISLNKLNELLTSEWLVESLHSIKLLQITTIGRQIKQLEKSKNKDNIKEVEDLKLQVLQVEEQKAKLLDLYLENIVDKIHYQQKISALESNLKGLNNKIQELSRDNDEIDSIIHSKRMLINKVNELKVEPYYTRQEIVDYIHYIIIEGNCLTISLNIGGEALELLEQITF